MMQASTLQAYIERIEDLDQQIAGLAYDKRDIYKLARAAGIDVKALKAVITYRRDPSKIEEITALTQYYIQCVERGTPIATRAGAREAVA